MRISDAKAPGCTNSMLFPGGRTGGLNGAYMCRIIRQARNQSPGMPPSSSLPPSEIPVSPNRRTQSFCLQITGRTPALSTVPGAHSHLFVFSPSCFFFFAPEKERGHARGGVEGGGLIEGEGRGLLCAKTFPWVHCFGCRCKALVGFSSGVCCLFSEGETRAKASGW